jgi:hypothetical protein
MEREVNEGSEPSNKPAPAPLSENLDKVIGKELNQQHSKFHNQDFELRRDTLNVERWHGGRRPLKAEPKKAAAAQFHKVRAFEENSFKMKEIVAWIVFVLIAGIAIALCAVEFKVPGIF